MLHCEHSTVIIIIIKTSSTGPSGKTMLFINCFRNATSTCAAENEENTSEVRSNGWLHPSTHPALRCQTQCRERHSTVEPRPVRNTFQIATFYIWILTYLDTWSGFESAKTAPWPSRGLHHIGKFLEPSDEWAGRGCCCFLMRWHSWAFLAHQEWAPEICLALILIFQF